MSHRILAVDDDIHIARAIQMKLARAGFEVETAPDGRAAWEAIERQPPDLLVTDCQMPRMGGIELCRRIRANPPTAQLPIIFLTAKGYEMDEEAIKIDLWLSALMGKPFSPRELLETVQNILADAEVGDRKSVVSDQKSEVGSRNGLPLPPVPCLLPTAY